MIMEKLSELVSKLKISKLRCEYDAIGDYRILGACSNVIDGRQDTYYGIEVYRPAYYMGHKVEIGAVGAVAGGEKINFGGKKVTVGASVGNCESSRKACEVIIFDSDGTVLFNRYYEIIGNKISIPLPNITGYYIEVAVGAIAEEPSNNCSLYTMIYDLGISKSNRLLIAAVICGLALFTGFGVIKYARKKI